MVRVALVALIVAVVAVAGLTSCAEAPGCEFEVVAGDAAVDGGEFAVALVEHLEAVAPKGAGFAFSDSRGEPLGRGACGLARDERGERLPFASSTPNNWGSVSKMITAAAAIRAVSEAPGASLDDPFGDYLPARWRASLHPGYASVTIRMLLQHRGGFGRDGEIYDLDADGEVRDLLAARLAGPPEGQVGVRSYSNISPILLHFVVARLVDPAGMAAEEAEIERRSPGDAFSRDINLAAATRYVEYVKERVLGPAGAVGSCRIADFSDHAYFYPDGESRRGTYPRADRGGDHTDECSAGGWVVDPEGMLAFLVALRHHGALVDPALAAAMADEGAVGDRLGYSSAVPTIGGHAFCHGGSYHQIHAAICSFPDGVQAVVNVNSEIEGGSSGLITALVGARERALRP